MGKAELIQTDPGVMGGVPCFVGTRVPVKIVLEALDAGDTLEPLRRAYPFLTKEHVDAARAYAASNPEAVAQNPAWIRMGSGAKP